MMPFEWQLWKIKQGVRRFKEPVKPFVIPEGYAEGYVWMRDVFDINGDVIKEKTC